MLINTSILGKYPGANVSIQGRLVGLESRIGKNGHAFLRLRIVDGFGEAWAYVWADSNLFGYVETINIGEYSLVELCGRVSSLNGYAYLKLSDLLLVSPSHIRNGASLLPLPLVPVRARESMQWLIDFIETLANEPLRAFLTDIFLDEGISHRFIRSRASANYHSAHPGGLLMHSVEVAKLAGQWADLLGESALSKAVTQVGGLLHDFGKIETVGACNPRPMNPAYFQHEHMTIHLLAPHISKLKKSSIEEGLIMMHLLSRFAAPKSMGSQLMAEELIRFADQASAGHKSKQKIEQFIRRLPKISAANDSRFASISVG